MNPAQPTIALVAGEASGDQLGAALVAALRERHPEARFVGVAGEKMKAAGVESWFDASELAVMGLFEVLTHLPRLLKLRRHLGRRLADLRPDVFIGIDAPDFNLGLEIKLRRAGIRTIHYVSPTVWAWREKRVKKIARAADRVLCLFPFEPEFYSGHGVSATYVGHPLADQIDADKNPANARSRLGLDPAAVTVGLLPGSRLSEVGRLAAPMLEAARLLGDKHPDMQFVAAMSGAEVDQAFGAEMQRAGISGVHRVTGDPRGVIAASDVVLCASGTATLEVMLVNRPMVMTYKLAPSTYRLGQALKLVKLEWFSLPNILARERLVPELIQDEATGPRLAAEVRRWLTDEDARGALKTRFEEMHAALRCNAASKAADAVTGLMETDS